MYIGATHATNCGKTLQHTASYQAAWQHTQPTVATHSNALQHTRQAGNKRSQLTATLCNTLQHTRQSGNKRSQLTATRCNTLQHSATHQAIWQQTQPIGSQLRMRVESSK